MKIFKILKHLTVWLTLAVGSAVLASEPINLLVPFPPGGQTDQITRAFERTLQTKGIKTNYLILNNCKSTEQWLLKNANKPAIVFHNLEEQINAMLNPRDDNACGIKASKENTLAIALSGYMNMCSMLPADQALAHFVKGKHKIGTTFSPPTNGVLVNGLIKDLKLNSHLIEYQGNPRLVQALVSKDIDFALFGNVAPAIGAGATCFFTTAPVAQAKNLGRTSLEELKSDSRWIGNARMVLALGFNVDKSTYRSLVIETMKTDENMQKQLSVGFMMPGMISGSTEAQQWSIITEHITRSTKQ